jgi:nucleoside-diphosphate-sugar epimerase
MEGAGERVRDRLEIMRILVIGGNGFIGRPLVRELISDGHRVAVLHRNLDHDPAEAKHFQGDRNRLPESVEELREFSPDVIVDMVLSSGEQARQLMAVANELGARVVAVSSMDVYRAWGVMLGTEPGGLEPMPLTEDSPLRTASRSYPPELIEKMKTIFTWVTPGYDKAAVEREVMHTGSRNTVVRLPMVYGPGDLLHRLYGVVKRVMDKRPFIILAEDHAAWRGPRGYVENVAHAIALAATSQHVFGRIYHVCDEPALSELEWQRKIVAQTDWCGRFVLLPSQRTPKHLLAFGNAAQHLFGNADRIRKELKYTELISMDEAIRRTIAWEQANPPNGFTFQQFDYPAEDAALNS